MDTDFAQGSLLLKALSDETRARIMHILSCGELCACDILLYFDLTQPTLSHHLAVLTVAGLIESRKKDKWTYYSISKSTVKFLTAFLDSIFLPSDECQCVKIRSPVADKELMQIREAIQ